MDFKDLRVPLSAFLVKFYVFLMQKIERLTAMLHSLDNQPPNRHVHYAEDRYELLGLSLLAIKENEIIELGILVALLFPFTTTCDCL